MATKTHVTKQEEAQVEKAVQIRAADPGSPVSNQTWVNTTEKKMKFYDGADIQNVGAAGVGSASTFALLQAEDGDISAFSGMAIESASPISGDKSYSISSLPATTPAISVDERRAGKSASCSFVQKLASGSYKAQIVDNTAAVLAEVTITASSAQKVVMKFGIPSAATTVQLKLVDVSSATTVVIDDIEFSDDAFKVADLGNTTDWVEEGPMNITAAGGGQAKGTVVIDSLKTRRVGDSLEMLYTFRQSAGGSTGSGNYLFEIPGGREIDSSKIGTFDHNAKVGQGFAGPGADKYNTIVWAADSTHLSMSNVFGTGVTSDLGGGALATSGDIYYTFTARVPIVGWTASNPAVVSTVESVAPVKSRYSSGTGIANSSKTYIDFATTVFDDQGLVTGAGSDNNTTYTNTWRFVAPAKGKYKVSGQVQFTATGNWGGGETILAYIDIDGSNQVTFRKDVEGAVTDQEVNVQFNDTLELQPGEALSIAIFQNSGGVIALSGSGNETFVNIEKLEPQVDLATTPAQKFQTKILSSNVTSNGVVSDLTFNNLEIGKTYFLIGQASLLNNPSQGGPIGTLKNGSTVIGGLQYDSSSVADCSVDGAITGGYFVATDTTVVLDMSSTSGTQILEGDGTKGSGGTWLTLVEIPGAYETSQWD